MSYCMESIDVKFLIKVGDKEAAFNALKDWAFGVVGKNDLSMRLGMSPIGKATLLEDALCELDWEPDMDSDGNIVEVFFQGHKLRQEAEWMDAIAPYVEAGSFIDMCGEDKSFWRWYFDGKNCIEYLGVIIFPDSPDTF